MSAIDFEKLIKIGGNNYGYAFGVGLVGREWFGFAMGEIENRKNMMFFFPGCDSLSLPESDDENTNRDEVIKMTIAYAQNPENSYGGISEWCIDEPLRDEPEDDSSLGTCCECEKTENVRNIWTLHKKSPLSGRGWGCVVCCLPADGAVAVLCDDCHERLSPSEENPKFACNGYPGSDGRIEYSELTGTHEHNFQHD